MSLLSSNFRIFFFSMMLCIFLFPVFSTEAGPFAGKSRPALQLTGTLDDTPRTVVLCAPLNIQYGVTSTGTLPQSGGQLSIEIKTAIAGRPVFAQVLPFTTEPSSFMINNVNFPQGAYSITLKASGLNLENQFDRESTLAEQALTVTAPIQVKKGANAMVRVLVWLGQTGTAFQQAYAEMIVKQAFEDNDVYYTTVDEQDEFTEKAMSGEFNTMVLFETDELLERSDWLIKQILRGQGLVIVGSEDRSRMLAETFGFTFREASITGAMLQLTEESGMGLSGNVPVSGRILLPQKKNAKPAAVYSGDKKPAILIDKAGNGRVIAMPFSFTRSALDSGSTSLYSLLLRSATLSAAPERDDQTGISSIELLVSAPSGPVGARVVETLPPGTRVIWTNAEGTVKNNTVIHDLIADTEPQRLQYLYQLPTWSRTPAVSEVFYECREKLVSQGKIE